MFVSAYNLQESATFASLDTQEWVVTYQAQPPVRLLACLLLLLDGVRQLWHLSLDTHSSCCCKPMASILLESAIFLAALTQAVGDTGMPCTAVMPLLTL